MPLKITGGAWTKKKEDVAVLVSESSLFRQLEIEY